MLSRTFAKQLDELLSLRHKLSALQHSAHELRRAIEDVLQSDEVGRTQGMGGHGVAGLCMPGRG
jgi:predicted phage-related endonuclease